MSWFSVLTGVLGGLTVAAVLYNSDWFVEQVMVLAQGLDPYLPDLPQETYAVVNNGVRWINWTAGVPLASWTVSVLFTAVTVTIAYGFVRFLVQVGTGASGS